MTKKEQHLWDLINQIIPGTKEICKVTNVSFPQALWGAAVTLFLAKEVDSPRAEEIRAAIQEMKGGLKTKENTG